MSDLIAKIKAAFGKLSPDQRRYTSIGMGVSAVAILAIVLVMVGSSVSGGEKRRARPSAKSVEFYPLTGKDTGSLSKEVLSERVKILEGELTKLKTGETSLGNTPNGSQNGSVAGGVAPSPNGTTLAGQVGSNGDVLPGDMFAPGIVAPPVRKKVAQVDTSVKAVETPGSGGDALFPDPLSGASGKPGVGNKPATDATVEFPGDSGGSKRKLEIREISQEEPKGEEAAKLAKSASTNLQEQGIFMPAGTIISGVLITGMDAPTANQSRRDPFPVLLRVKDESLLPNRMKMDIRECFIIASGYGDMSSERAYIRADTVSCVRDDGGVIEAGLNAYAVGEDGKNGVRGRLVSKTGSMVAKSLMAGFLAGTAEALKPQKIPVQAIVDPVTGQKVPQIFSDIDPSVVFSQGAMGGASSSMGKIADYYIEMAKSIFPIIEVDSGRKIDFVVVRGAKLAVQSNSRGNQNANRNANRGATRGTGATGGTSGTSGYSSQGRF